MYILVLVQVDEHHDKSSLLLSFIAYGGGAAGGYEYGSYYAPMGPGGSGSMVDNGSGQQSGNSPGNPADYEHDNHYGKAKTSIVSSPTYHPYSRS